MPPMTLNYKYKLYVCKNTGQLSQLITSANFAWNHVVELARRHYRLYHKDISCARLQKHMAKLRKHNPFWAMLGSQTMQDICQKYTEALKQHFRNGRGFPRPHKCFGKGSILFKQGVGYTIGVGESSTGRQFGALVINSLGKNIVFKFKATRPWGDIRTLRVVRDTDGCLYVVVTCRVNVEEKQPKEERGPIGLDFGLKAFLTTSDGNKIQMPDFNRANKEKVSSADRSYSLKKKAAKYGTNFRRAKKAKSKAHRKEVNQRSDFHWKLSHELCRNHSVIAIEDLNLDGMKRLWGRKVSTLAYGDFVQKLMYVAHKYGTEVVKVDRYFASSQRCSDCGYVNKEVKDLSVREWVCPQCGCVHDRDVNAAVNILSAGLSLIKPETGRALSVAEGVVSRVGNGLETAVDARSPEDQFLEAPHKNPTCFTVGVCQNYCEDIELGLTHEDAHLCSHQGLCDVDCEMVVNEPYVHEQLSKYTDEELRKSVKAYGVEDVDTFDRHRLEMHVVWLVAGNIVDEE